MSEEKKTALPMIINSFLALEEQLIEMGGELTPELDEWASKVDLELTENLYRRRQARFHLQEEAKKYKEMESRYKKARQVCENIADKIIDGVKTAMIEIGKKEAGPYKLAPTKEALVIEDLDKIPQEFKTQVISYELDKEKIRSVLAIGGSVPGAKLVGGFQIRESKKGEANV